jgi:transcriptional regulator with XRE-family HTH domain
MGKRTAIDRPEIIDAEEAFVVDVQVCIHTLMNAKGWSRADLARALEVSPARVSQMFADDASDLRLRTVARIFAVMGESCRLSNPTVEDRLARDQASYAAEFGQAVSEQEDGYNFAVELKRLAATSASWQEGPGNDNDPDDCWPLAA